MPIRQINNLNYKKFNGFQNKITKPFKKNIIFNDKK